MLDHYTLPDLANDVAALLDYLGIERAIVIGSSAGGPIALQYGQGTVKFRNVQIR